MPQVFSFYRSLSSFPPLSAATSTSASYYVTDAHPNMFNFLIDKKALILTGNPWVCAQEGPNMLVMSPSYQKVAVLQLCDRGYWTSNHQFSLDDSRANDAVPRC